MEINLLLRLFIAHLIADFFLQPDSWVNEKKERKIRSKKLLLHVIVSATAAYLLSGYYSGWIIPAVIFLSHYLIDLLKSYGKDSFSLFIADQAAHILVLLLLWYAIEGKEEDIRAIGRVFSENRNFLVTAAAYLFVSWPLGIIIGMGTRRWRNQIALEQDKAKRAEPVNTGGGQNDRSPEQNDPEIDDNLPKTTIIPSEEQELGLANAGKWIGICERTLILTFIIMQQYTAIGFLMTAKSILRFSEKESNTQLKTEYVLVGTLVSFTSAAITGVLTRFALG